MEKKSGGRIMDSSLILPVTWTEICMEKHTTGMKMGFLFQKLNSIMENPLDR